MKNKVLIKVIVPEIDNSFDLFIPVNEVVWKIEKLIAKSVYDLSRGDFDMKGNYVLINKLTSEQYKKNDLIIDTNIRNATELLFLSNFN